MNPFLPLKKQTMKTGTLAITADSFRRYLIVATATALAAAMLVTTATAQGRHGGGDRGVNGGGNFGRSRPEQNRTPGNSNRGFGSSSERSIPGRDFNRGGNSSRGFDRNSSIDRGNNNRGFGRTNDIVRNEGTRDINRNSNGFPGRDRASLPNGGDRNISRGNNVNNRPGIQNRPADRGFGNRPSNRPVVGSYNRPAYRPYYGYNRRPVYDRYNPAWRYGYLPRRNSCFYSLPSTYFSISFGGIGYRYWDGVFYRPYNNLFTVIAPPIGIYIDVLPVGYRTVYVRDYPYYYYNGTYYDQRQSHYYVVSPPVGAVVESLPAGYETVVIDGETFYTADGAQYKPAIQQNGEIWYEVIKAN